MATSPPIDVHDERALLEGLTQRDPRTREAFLSATHRPVYCLACRVTRDRDLRQDWTHTALLSVLADIEQGRFVFRHAGGFWSWFRKRVYFRLLDERRRHLQQVAREHSVDAHSEDAPDLSEFGVESNPTGELERVELAAAVEDCLSRIAADKPRRALALMLDHELDHAAIAAAMTAPANSVRVWVMRGRVALRRCLAERWGLTGPERRRES